MRRTPTLVGRTVLLALCGWALAGCSVSLGRPADPAATTPGQGATTSASSPFTAGEGSSSGTVGEAASSLPEPSQAPGGATPGAGGSDSASSGAPGASDTPGAPASASSGGTATPEASASGTEQTSGSSTPPLTPADELGVVRAGLAAPRFGEAYRWPEGLTIFIDAPRPFTPSPSAAGVWGHERFVAHEVTLTNRGEAEVRAADLRLQATSASGEASRVFDSTQGITLPSARLAQGESLHYLAVFGVDDPATERLEAVWADEAVAFTPRTAGTAGSTEPG